MRAEGRSGQINVDEAGGSLTITRDGLMMKPIWGNTPPYTIPFANITGLHFQAATLLGHGYLSLGVRGSSYFQGKAGPAVVKDAGSVTFVSRQQAPFERVHQFLLTRLGGRAPASAAPRSNSGPSVEATGFAMKALRAASGVGPLDKLLDSVLDRAEAAAAAGQPRVTVSFNQADIGVRNTFDQAVSYLMTGLEQHGLAVSNVQGGGWDRTRVIVVDLPVAVAPAASGLAVQISQLAELHRTGALSDAEFAAAKAQLLP